MEECLKALQQKIICRKTEISTLYSLLSSRDSLPQSLYVLGHCSTAKSLVIRSILEYLNYNFCIINCIENPTTKHLLERITSELWRNVQHSSSPLELLKSSPKCNNIYELIINLKNIISINNSNIVIVFENCAKLRDFDANLLPALFRLKELSGINVCTIFVSEVVYEKVILKNDLAEPIKVYFSQYTREQVEQILLFLEKDNKEIDTQMYEIFLSLFLSTFYRFCRDLMELHYMARLNFERYMEPIKKGLCDMNNHRFLWHHISPILSSNLEVLYLRISADELNDRKKLVEDMDSTIKLIDSFELPFYSKYMLLAAFLASYVPPKLDKKLFRIESDKKKKRLNRKNKKIFSLMTAVPHAFSLNRMLGIFCYIVNENVDINAVLLSQISTMCRLGLLMPVGLNILDEVKYKCCADFQMIEVIAKLVKCNIIDYLKAI